MGGFWTKSGVATLLGLLALGAAASAAAHPHPGDSTQVLSIQQTGYITPQGNFTVSLQVSSSAQVSLVYFTFCQLTSPVCYLPVTMTLHAGNWFVGTTNPMSSYNGMKVGVHAGYNITIVFADNTTMAEPSIPNAFGNLSIVQSVTNEYMFGMWVSPQVYELSGAVHDSVTGAPLSGATVDLIPANHTVTSTTTNSAGAYSFPAVVNGSYTLSVSKAGYRTTNQSVTLAGTNSVENVQVVNASTPVGPSTSSNGPPTILGLPFWEFILPFVAVGGVVTYLLITRVGRGGRPATSRSPPDDPTQ